MSARRNVNRKPLDDRERRVHHRGRRKSKKARRKNMILNVILAVAIVVFCVSAFKLLQIGKGYKDGQSEYEKVRDVAIKNADDKEKFRVDFDELMKINDDTVGWIRFYKEPSQINYPVVQGEDNDLYLHKTFSANENTLGAIFVDAAASSDFTDKNTIIYGHRMKDGSMFRKLEEYKDKDFWKENPYFYIYTPDGKEITYKIYSVGQVLDTSDTYLTSFAGEEDYQKFLDMTMKEADYDTGVKVTTDDTIVTLSTCTAASDENRFVVRGVKEKEVELR